MEILQYIFITDLLWNVILALWNDSIISGKVTLSFWSLFHYLIFDYLKDAYCFSENGSSKAVLLEKITGSPKAPKNHENWGAQLYTHLTH